MLDKLNNHWQWLIFLSIGILFPLRMAIAEGGIVTDGTMGPAQTLSGPKVDVDIEQNLGTTVGKNLFHSFSEFNVKGGQTVTFKENTPNALDNVISRVTGGSRSDINGTLSSTPGGHANLYLVNPSGVMFGKNARIDVPGAFHASTADEVRFQDGARFSASQPTGSTLTAAAPASFGFLGTSSATNGLLRVDGAQLAVKPGQKLDMVGRNINIENGAKLSAPEGEVKLEAVGKGSMNIPISQPSNIANGTLTLTRSTIDASGDGGGKVIVRGSDLNMDQEAKILAETNGKKNGVGIDVRLSDDLTMKSGSRISASTLGSGAAGRILVVAKNLLIDGQTTSNDQPIYLKTSIDSESGDRRIMKDQLTGSAGNIALHIANKLSLVRGGRVGASSFGKGNAGSVTVKAGELLIDGQGIDKLTTDKLGNPLLTGIFAGVGKASSSKGGKLDVTVQGDINMKGGAEISTSTHGKEAAAGNIHVKAKNLSIDGLTDFNRQKIYLPTLIASTAGSDINPDEETGNAGNIDVNIDNYLSLLRGGQISTSSFNTGNAGTIMVNADQLLIDRQGALDNLGDSLNTGIFTAAKETSSTKSGVIEIIVQGDINMKGGGVINASTYGKGNAGNIYVKANNLLLDGQTTLNHQKNYFLTYIVSEASLDAPKTGIAGNAGNAGNAAGNAGDITLDIANRLALIQGGQISSTTFDRGNAGKIIVNAGQLLIDGQGAKDNSGKPLQTAIFTQAADTKSGRGGNIDVIARGNIVVKGGGEIDASTFGKDAAGDIYIKANNLLLDGQTALNGQKNYLLTSTSIDSTAGSGEIRDEKTGNAGHIKLDIDGRLELIRGGLIRTSSLSTGDAGKVTVNASQLLIDGQGVTDDPKSLLSTGILTQAPHDWSGTGGDITVDVRGDLAIKIGGKIDASSRGSKNAGNITISAGELSLEQNSRISSESVSGNGGNITIKKSQLIQLINSGFQTSVSGQQGGDGGNISVNGEILVMETGLIQANTNAQGGSGGRIDLKLSGLIPSGANLVLGGDQPIEDWKPYEFGFNVIQAAAPNGISGHIQSTAPQLDLSGVLSNLGMPQFDTTAISQDYCSLGTGSSLIRQGKGGLPPRSRDSVMY